MANVECTKSESIKLTKIGEEIRPIGIPREVPRQLFAGTLALDAKTVQFDAAREVLDPPADQGRGGVEHFHMQVLRKVYWFRRSMQNIVYFKQAKCFLNQHFIEILKHASLCHEVQN